MNDQTEFQPSQWRLLWVIILVAILSIIFSLLKGSTSISFYQLFDLKNGKFNPILWQLRLPRTVCAFVSGGLLALAGSLMQLLVQNPLADPYILGISGGTALITLLMMLAGYSQDWLLLGGWLGSLGSIAIIFTLARKHHWQAYFLLLTGIALSFGFAAAISLILFIAPNDSLHGMMFWLNGDLNATHFPLIEIGILIASLILCMILSPGLDLLYRGEREAAALGLSLQRYRILLFLLSSLLTATAVTLAGCIGFIGLIIPHITRLLCGFNHRINLPIAVLLGGCLLTVADTFSRTLFAPQQIPVGILMALIGIPTFIWLLQR